MTSVFKRYLHAWLAHIRYGLIREMMFRGNFLLWIVVESLWLGLNLVFIEVLYGHVDSIAGWSKYQMMMLVGTHYVIQQLFQAFAMSGLFGLSEHIRMGSLDYYLLKPINPQFLLTIHRFDPGALVNSAIGFIVIYIAATHEGIAFTWGHSILFLSLTCVGLFVHYALLLMIVSISFWTTQAQSAMMGYYTISQLARLPREASKGIVRVVFTYIIPMFLVANVPIKSFQGNGSPSLWITMFVMTAIFFSISIFVFRIGLKNYRSASS